MLSSELCNTLPAVLLLRSSVTPQEFFLKAVCVCSTLGCLTALQVAQLMVSMFPFPATMNQLAQEIARRWDEQQEQQLAAALAATAVGGSGRNRAGKRQQRG